MKYWWAVIETEKGRTLAGAYLSEAEAQQKGSERGRIIALFELNTRDDAKASRIVKHQLESMENLNHAS